MQTDREVLYVLNCIDGCIPSDMATRTPEEIEEERRLLYVAMPRAKDALHLVTPLRFYVHGQASRGDKHVYAARTRFIPHHALGAFELRTWATPGAGAGRAGQGPRHLPSRDLGARVRGMWA